MLLFESKGCEVVISLKRNRKVQRFYDKNIYKERECFFSKIKNSRRIFSRFDKTAEVFIGFLNFVDMACINFCSQSLQN
ncbi:hypothetical protein WSTR_01865 [Wolbachia endosymbiont of Laodelphax striatellus]|nr:hypothetical protein WSTR_01865 [Wolbachia endosymbiont of Laodelphax striatellus]